ncbi:hypothetical protein PFFVO_02297 [Plasmodium falciparum Vietnam Oak-Knoll (FVO)]|uniref:Uncharacterized protein n=1 Tax=Plasmodium falciparum Vietnam Oak-Knoll (FVO) TaxID=1036723 RepID=A0A024V7L2_PLAFA|nr:hypothetical protein PFFVO_02297 [Plasmodium falciparum Vietnam Oak-Knoll (FVO)]
MFMKKFMKANNKRFYYRCTNYVYKISKNEDTSILLYNYMLNNIQQYFKFLKYLLFSHLLLFTYIYNKHNTNKYCNDKHHFINNSYNKLLNRSLAEVNENNSSSIKNKVNQNVTRLRREKPYIDDNNKKCDKNEHDITQKFTCIDNTYKESKIKPTNLEQLIFKKKEEEKHFDTRNDLSFIEKIKFVCDAFDDLFIEKILDFHLQKKTSEFLRITMENLVAQYLAFFPFSLARFRYLVDRINFFNVRHCGKKKKDIFYITEDKKDLYGVK